MYMKQVQLLFDEELLSRLDEDSEVRAHGRSAVLRGLAADYLRAQREAAFDDLYRRGYGNQDGLGSEFEGWEDEGSWPDR
jgi:metal-responsive CopG/Arc/MetJ family transcriptional regulator